MTPKPPPADAPSRRRLPRRYIISNECTRFCSLNREKLPGEMAETIHGWYEAGLTNGMIQQKAAIAGINLSNGAIGRHASRHLVPVDQAEDPTTVPLPQERLSDLEILERMIQRGAQNLHHATFRVSPEQMLKALDMKYRLTQGSPFEKFLEAAYEAMADDEAEGSPAEETEAEADAGTSPDVS
jgi:hypothetical protein